MSERPSQQKRQTTNNINKLTTIKSHINKQAIDQAAQTTKRTNEPLNKQTSKQASKQQSSE